MVSAGARALLGALLLAAVASATNEQWVNTAKSVVGSALKGQVASPLSRHDECIFCQFILERVERAVKTAGILPHMGPRANRDSTRSTYHADAAWDNTPGAPDDAPSFVEAGASQPDGGDEAAPPAPPAGRGNGGSGGLGGRRLPSAPFPQSNAFARHPMDAGAGPSLKEAMAAQSYALFSQINHVIDLALDDVCEASMPNDFYQYCTPILQRQGKIANMLGRQFKPQDICADIAMCRPDSYIFSMLKHTQRPAGVATPMSLQRGVLLGANAAASAIGFLKRH